MIFVWGLPDDDATVYVLDALARRNAPIFFFNQKDVAAAEVSLEVSTGVSGTFSDGEDVLDLRDVSAVYMRPCESVKIPSVQRAGEGSELYTRAGEIDDILLSWTDMTEAFVVNRVADMSSNSSKPYQALLIEAAGFMVPETLITTSAEEVRAFEAKHGEIIYKSVSGVRSIVSRFSTKMDPERLARLSACPTQFQRCIPGEDYRVHVVGEDVFTSHIVSNADDYRYAKKQNATMEMKATTLPPEIAERCVRMAHSLRLWVAGIDLRLTPDGEWYCFEVNPSPGFTFFQDLSGFPIDEAIAELLISKAAGA